ncbi:MAG: hypothetical protein AAF215_19880 [Cyanobacteria bacterium P01_A01_bin.123]
MQENSKRNPKTIASKPVKIIELGEKDLAAIAGEKIAFNHNKTTVSAVNSSQFFSESESSKIFELTKEDLAAIGGGMTCPWELCGANHNETIVNVENSSQVDAQSELVQIVELTREDLAAIAAGISSGRPIDGGCPIDQCGGNHNETIVNVDNSSQVGAQSELMQIVGLMETDLEALAEPLLRGIVGAGVDPANHNETMASTAINNQTIQKFLEDDLTLICGGRTKEDDEPLAEN